MSEQNFFNQLNELNANLGVNNSNNGAKYDYERANVAKREQKSFRIKVRQGVEAIYHSENVDAATIKKFAEFQQNILLACTKTKRTFQQLQVSEVYPNFAKLNPTEKKQVETNHKKFVELLTKK